MIAWVLSVVLIDPCGGLIRSYQTQTLECDAELACTVNPPGHRVPPFIRMDCIGPRCRVQIIPMVFDDHFETGGTTRWTASRP